MSESIQGIAGASGKIPLPNPVKSGGNEKTKQAVSQNSTAGDVLAASIDQTGTYATKNTGAAMVMAASIAGGMGVPNFAGPIYRRGQSAMPYPTDSKDPPKTAP